MSLLTKRRVSGSGVQEIFKKTFFTPTRNARKTRLKISEGVFGLGGVANFFGLTTS